MIARLLVAMVLIAVVAGCSGDAETAPGHTSDDLRYAVQAYSDSYLTGDIAAYELLSARCQERFTIAQFHGLLAAAESAYGVSLPLRTFAADVSGDLARATYTYDVAAIDQQAEPWTREGGQWKQDDC